MIRSEEVRNGFSGYWTTFPGPKHLDEDGYVFCGECEDLMTVMAGSGLWLGCPCLNTEKRRSLPEVWTDAFWMYRIDD